MLGIGNYLWRLVPGNPILLRVVEGGGKRKRDLFIRCGYLGALLFLVIFLLLPSMGSLGNASLAALSKQSAEIFYWMSYVQLALVALLAPIFTAGAITQEKDSQTYDILLATPLTNGQIVLGSLLSRLFFVVALLISGIPIFSITQIFGGIAIGDIVMACLIAMATAFVTGALAMAIAVFKVGTRRTIFSFYLFILLYLAIPLALEAMGYLQYQWALDNNTTTHVSWLAGVHPFLALKVIFGHPDYRAPDLGMVQAYGWPWNWYLSSPHTFYVTFMLVMSLILVLPSILVLRRLAQSTLTFRSWLFQKLHITTGDRTRKPRHVWANPIAWREAKTKASANRAVMLRYGFMLAGLAIVVTLLVMVTRRDVVPEQIGAAAYNAESKTLVVLKGEEPVTYAVRLPASAPGWPPRPSPTATKFILGDRQIQPEALYSGMEVLNLTADTASGENALLSLVVGPPRTLLSPLLTRQFLLGAMMVELAVILLILTQSAASTVTREKEDGTLEMLLTTPITSRYYIWGKLRGLVSFVLPLVAVPAASVLVFAIHGLFVSSENQIVHWEAVLVLPPMLVMICAFAAILGMQMSLRCRRTVMAVMSSVGIVAAICGALWLCGAGAMNSSSLLHGGVVIGAFSPFSLMALLVSPMDVTGGNYPTSPTEQINIRIFVFFGGLAAAAVYAMIVWAMYKSMVRNFDMTIRRQST